MVKPSSMDMYETTAVEVTLLHDIWCTSVKCIYNRQAIWKSIRPKITMLHGLEDME